MKNSIINFELENFENSGKGVNLATTELTRIFENISTNVCKIKTRNKDKHIYKRRKPWSDNEIRNLKSRVNYIGKQLKNKPFDKSLKNNYFTTIKDLRKMCKKKKYDYQQKFIENLFNCKSNDPQKFWKLLKSNNENSNKKNCKLEIDPDQLKNHFQTQGNFKNINKEFEDKITNILEDSNMFHSNENTDNPIRISEVNKVIKNLKNSKAAGPDLLLSEIIKYSSQVTVKAMTKLFNLIFQTGCYPDSWNKAFIVTVFKSGDKEDPNNYRGISLVNTLAKIFSAVLNNRIMLYMKDKFSAVQFGFRPNHRTADSVFIVKTLITKYLSLLKKPIYACFVDLRKAFDSIWRKALFFKLMSAGVGRKMVNIIKSMYLDTKSSLKIDGYYSEYFNINRGVRQGDSLSPTLFNIFINDLSEIFLHDTSFPLTLDTTKIGSLLFADDLVILSESKEGLQSSLDKLGVYCDKWQLTVNGKKTKAMVISNKYKRENMTFLYKNEKIETVKEFKFLGNYISENGNFISSAKFLSQKALKVMYSIRSYISNANIMPANLSCHIFDSLVRPILTFNSEIWYMDVYRSFYNSELRVNNNEKSINNYFNFIDRSIVDKVHTKFCKFTLGVKKCASNLAARSDLGRYPVDCFIKTQSLLYEDRLHQTDINPILKECYTLCKILHLEGIYSWYTYIDHVRNYNQLSVCNDDSNQNINCSCKISGNKAYYKKELGNQYIKKYEEKLQNLDTNSKLILFKFIQSNHNYNLQYYLHNFNFEYRKLICKFRISDHSLEIEQGRYKQNSKKREIV